ncbi:MAG: efflux RND transporter periplasmic adaptor subunit [Burkholderiales bacterium]|nr:efflux RND transporter periplasmic adaptor subunit [Burkholderiales bacterium]
MNVKLIYTVVAAVGLGGLGWYAYTYQKNPAATGFEVKGGAAGDGKGGDAKGTEGKGGGKGADGKGGGGPGGPGGPRGPVGVEVAKVDRRPLADEVVAVGSLRANETVTLRSEVAGRIERVGFGDGARVQRGTTLIALDASVAAAEAEQSRAELALARANYERTVELAQRNFVSASAKDQAAANLKIQEAKLRLAEAKLAKSEIRAPFSGVMGLRNVSPGDFVKDGADLAVIEDIATMKVDLRMPERYLGSIKVGQVAQLSFDSLPGKTFKATISAIDAQIDANGRSLLARGKLANPDGALRSGMFARARVVVRANAEALTIPEEAVISQGADTFVWKVDAGKAVRTKIEIGLRRDARAEVLSGLAFDDLVVSAGQLRLQRDGQEVRVIDPNRRPPGGPGGAGGPGGPAGPGSVGAPKGDAPMAAAAPGGAPAAAAAPAAPAAAPVGSSSPAAAGAPAPAASK